MSDSMTIFHYSFLFTLLLAAFCGRKSNGKRLFCILTGILYFAIAALRSTRVGGDTWNYANMFAMCKVMPFQVFFSQIADGKDAFFYMVMAGVAKSGMSFNTFMAIIAACFTYSVWKHIYRYSIDPFLSIVFLLAFNLYQFSLTGLRQTLALSAGLAALRCLRDKKLFRAVLMICVASLCHESALILLVMVFFQKMNINRKQLLISLPVLGIVFLARTRVAGLLIPFISERGYELSDSTSGYTMAVVCFVLYTMFVVFYNEYEDFFKDSSLLAGLMFLACFFEMLVPAQNIFFRLAFYFLIVGVEAIPNTAAALHDIRSRKLVQLALYVLLSIQYLCFTIGSSYVLPYTTFWQI